ncbi:formate/nitrite transporter family protein [Cryobacterium melibiosiphilum]|uniref:Formate/nitrite transporter family protein n=1 Tax=Cryobacterium melibiosiphilum TaxID=995039 RepID=A0A3A5MGK4_9MICO|nr:formate/nitrite transporter family protein [Cryobacterium melibiosiphilum]RJT84676.1 formate/nitrite transporter family protein [Cryobacterium melibiosiphilum]
MSYVTPTRLIDAAVQAGIAKANLSIGQLLARGTLAGAILACATTLAYTGTAQTGLPLVGALIFPIGFVMIVLLGLELVTGSFALIPLAVLEGRTSVGRMLRNFGVVIVGHLLGCGLYAGLYLATITRMGTDQTHPLIATLIAAAEAKTTGYEILGASGIALVIIKAILCNWMVAFGAILALSSTSTGGKIVAMWLPVCMFFALGFEHAVVNMFVIPAGMLLGADVSIGQWWGWNQLPVLVGNFIGAVTLCAGLFYFSHRTHIQRADAVGLPAEAAAPEPVLALR